MNIKYMNDYFVVIRTLGTAGEKYASLLQSIDNQTIKARGVYVFIADGYSLPKEKLGYENFVYTRKGMWHQRIYGMQYVAERHPNSFLLVLDDDISFESDFVEKMFQNIRESDADVMIPGFGKVGNFKRNVICALNGSRYESSKTDYRISICATSGFIVSTKMCNLMPTQSGRFNIFMINSSCINKLELEDEYWVEDCKYALPDDQVFFYKCFLKGLTQISCITPKYTHLDHGSSNPNRRIDMAHAQGRNYLIFWHRFLFKPCKSIHKKIILCFAILYRLIMNCIIIFISCIVHKNLQILKSYMLGLLNGMRFINSNDYKIMRKL